MLGRNNSHGITKKKICGWTNCSSWLWRHQSHQHLSAHLQCTSTWEIMKDHEYEHVWTNGEIMEISWNNTQTRYFWHTNTMCSFNLTFWYLDIFGTSHVWGGQWFRTNLNNYRLRRTVWKKDMVVLSGPGAFHEKRKHVLIKLPAKKTVALSNCICEYIPQSRKGYIFIKFEDRILMKPLTPGVKPTEGLSRRWPFHLFPASWTAAVVLEAGSWRRRTLAETFRGGDDWERSLDHPDHRVSRSGRKSNFRPHARHNLKMGNEWTWWKHDGKIRVFFRVKGVLNLLKFTTGDVPFQSNLGAWNLCKRNLMVHGHFKFSNTSYLFAISRISRVFDAWRNKSQQSVNKNAKHRKPIYETKIHQGLQIKTQIYG